MDNFCYINKILWRDIDFSLACKLSENSESNEHFENEKMFRMFSGDFEFQLTLEFCDECYTFSLTFFVVDCDILRFEIWFRQTETVEKYINEFYVLFNV